MAPIPKMIVAEISKNWRAWNLRMDQGGPDDGKVPIGQQFEDVIDHNAERGYVLHSWRYNAASPDEENLCETIIAVFERRVDDEA